MSGRLYAWWLWVICELVPTQCNEVLAKITHSGRRKPSRKSLAIRLQLSVRFPRNLTYIFALDGQRNTLTRILSRLSLGTEYMWCSSSCSLIPRRAIAPTVWSHLTHELCSLAFRTASEAELEFFAWHIARGCKTFDKLSKKSYCISVFAHDSILMYRCCNANPMPFQVPKMPRYIPSAQAR